MRNILGCFRTSLVLMIAFTTSGFMKPLLAWSENRSEFYLSDFCAEPVTGQAALLVQFTDSSITNRPAKIDQNYKDVFDGQRALRFKGGVAACPAAPELNLTDAVTIEAVIKPAAWGDIESIVDKSNISLLLNGEGSSLNDHSLAVWLSTTGSAPGFITSPENSLDLGDCRHVAITYDGHSSEVKLFIDGLEQAPLNYYDQRPSGSIIDNSTFDLFIGNSANKNWVFDGIIDEVRVWNIVRSPEDIFANMNLKLSGYEPGLVAYWQMKKGYGNYVFDGSINGNHARLDSLSWVSGYENSDASGGDSAGILQAVIYPGQNSSGSFKPSPTIEYDLPAAAHINLKIFDRTGQLVRTLVNEKKEAGHHSVIWDRKNNQNREVKSGVYVYRIESNNCLRRNAMIRL